MYINLSVINVDFKKCNFKKNSFKVSKNIWSNHCRVQVCIHNNSYLCKYYYDPFKTFKDYSFKYLLSENIIF